MVEPVRTGYSRVFLLEQKAGPETAPAYQSFWKAGSFTFDQGDVTVVRAPSDGQYDGFIPIGKIIGAPGNPKIDLTSYMPLDAKSLFLRLATRGCDNDIHIHFGNCQDPKDFNGGWTKILVIENARPTSYSTEDLGALDADQRAIVHETLPITGETAYEIFRIGLARQADVQLTREAMDVSIVDAINCGQCGLPSDGTNKVFVLEAYSGGSPGVNAQIVATKDGGKTWIESTIASLGATQSARRIMGSGNYLVVLSDDSDSVHYALMSAILANAGATAWSQNTSGFVATKGPRAGFSFGATFNWAVGEGGYIYFTNDVTSAWVVQDPGTLTIANLNDIHGYDASRLVAVGDGNIVLYTTNGGATWSAAPGGGPAVGVNLNCVFMRTDLEWWVGTATGRLFYTRDGGTSWTEKAFPGSGSGVVRDIQFPSRNVGYMSHDTVGGAGRILRSISAGNSWYVAPEGTGTIPTNTRINQLAATPNDVNTVYGAGIQANNDGILIKGS
jgi:photosystem II stability/assembly factor-like uncharacterized protein